MPTRQAGLRSDRPPDRFVCGTDVTADLSSSCRSSNKGRPRIATRSGPARDNERSFSLVQTDEGGSAVRAWSTNLRGRNSEVGAARTPAPFRGSRPGYAALIAGFTIGNRAAPQVLGGRRIIFHRQMRQTMREVGL